MQLCEAKYRPWDERRKKGCGCARRHVPEKRKASLADNRAKNAALSAFRRPFLRKIAAASCWRRSDSNWRDRYRYSSTCPGVNRRGKICTPFGESRRFHCRSCASTAGTSGHGAVTRLPVLSPARVGAQCWIKSSSDIFVSPLPNCSLAVCANAMV